MPEPTEQQRRAGARMRRVAEEQGMKAYDVAQRLGVRPPTVYRWYQGSRPSQALLEQFADLVGMPVSEFYAEEAEPSEAALQLLVRWANRVMAGESSVQALRVAGMAVEDLSPLEVSGLIASEAHLRAELSRASQGGWNALSLEQRANILLALTKQNRDDTTTDDPPAPDGAPQTRPHG